jgi:hypothetical protein
VAAQTFRIVRRIFADNILVRIVAGQTTDAGIGSIEALAVGQAVRLEADIDLTLEMASHHCLPGTVTLAAKARNIF